jgi:hypothetical protein
MTSRKYNKKSKRTYRMIGEEFEEIPEMKCQSERFIQRLYDVLRRGRDNCFLEGAFVISDDNGKVFQALTDTCFDEERKSLNTMRNSVGSITHDVFMNPGNFRNVHRGSRLDLDFLATNGITSLGRFYNSYSQYENDIRDSRANVKELTFLCNPECKQDPSQEQCIDSRRKVKRVILFYPFMVIKNAIRNVDEVKKRYIYFKLEDSHAISLSHAMSAAQAYISPVSSDDSGFDYRRERTTKQDEERYKTRLRQKDERFYYDLFRIGRNNENVRFYNDYVRSNDEFFIPQEMTNEIINSL